MEPTREPPVILVVLDDSERAALLKLSLVSRGWEVLAAHSCEQARACMGEREGGVDALLTDLVLPDGSAFGLLRTIGSHVRVRAVLTWGNQHGIRERIAVSGFDLHLVRPISPDEIDGALRAALDAPHVQLATPTPAYRAPCARPPR